MRAYNINGKKMGFDSHKFNVAFKQYAKSNNMTKTALYNEIGDDIGVSFEAVRNWSKNANGPGDIETINKIENYLGVETNSLLTEIEGGAEVQKLTDNQIKSFKKVYDKSKAFMFEFESTHGFNDICKEFKEKGSKDPIKETYVYLDKRMKEIALTIEQENFYFRNADIYTELWDWLGAVYDIYNDKINPSFDEENYEPTDDEDYKFSTADLESILNKYLPT